ncbi:MAG: lipocalin family protein [Bacteroidota bacterium]
MKLFFFSGVLLSMTLFSSCKKKEEVSLPPAQLLAAKSWKLTDTGFMASGMPSSYFSHIDDCSKDDLEIYKSDGNQLTDEGVTKCSSTDPQQTNNGMWTLSADGKIITLKKGTTITTYTITELTGTTFKYTSGDKSTGLVAYYDMVAQ